jgi:hypothetical protein
MRVCRIVSVAGLVLILAFALGAQRPAAGKGGAGAKPSNNPTVARTAAGKVDLSLFTGVLKFGDKLQLPACVYEQGLLGMRINADDDKDCIDDQTLNNPLALAVLGMMVPNAQPDAPDPTLKLVFLAVTHRPGWISGESVWVKLIQGSVARVVVQTQGRVVEKRVGDDLKAKYGSVYFTHGGTITPDVGNKFDVNNLEWSLPGLHVEYRVIEGDLNGRVEVNGTGYVRIETESAYQARIAEEKKQKKSVL